MRRKNKKMTMIIALIIGGIFMGVGYALLSSSLEIESNNEVDGNWNIYIENIEATTINGTAISRNVERGLDGLSASFVVDLYDEGDYVEYTVSVVNKGTIKAKLNTINTNVINGSSNISMTNTAVVGSLLDLNGTMTFTVRIGVDGASEELVDHTGTIYELSLNYLQAK